MALRQLNKTLSIHLFAMLMLLTLLPPAHVLSLACNACGPECANACGTAMFRACCFNYNRKRSIPILEPDNIATDIVGNLSEGTDGTAYTPEVSLGKINPLFKHYLDDKWLRFFERSPEEIRERGHQYHLGNYM